MAARDVGDPEAEPLAVIGEYELWEKLGGEGPGSTVWRAVHRPSSSVVALKQVRLAGLSRALLDSLRCEIDFLAGVCHPNIVRLLDFFQVPYPLALILFQRHLIDYLEMVPEIYAFENQKICIPFWFHSLGLHVKKSKCFASLGIGT